jgi:hypothetical protein
MATPLRPVVLRFRFGQGLVKARKESEDTSRFVARGIALAYAEDTWNSLRKDLQLHIQEDVRAELVNLSRMFRKYIIGAGGSRSSPAGTLTTIAKGPDQPSASLSSMLPPWAKRSQRYMNEKKDATGSRQWFDNTGWPSHYGGRHYPDSGYLKKAFAPGTGRGSDIWESMFGPISVRIVKNSTDAAAANLSSVRVKNHDVEIQVASIYVSAFKNIDMNMLSAFRSKQSEGFSSIIRGFDPELGMRLGNMNNGVYRPTLEPFIDFFLTRALPQAVNERIRKGTLGSLFRR